jgi:hypothetical protein
MTRKEAVSASTLVAYNTDWRLFGEWCAPQGIAPLQAAAEDIRRQLLDLHNADRSWGRITRMRSAIDHFMLASGNTLPPTRDETVVQAMRTITEVQSNRPSARATAADAAVVIAVLRACDDAQHAAPAVRDRAMIALTWDLWINLRDTASMEMSCIRFPEDRPHEVIIRRHRYGDDCVLTDDGDWRPVEWLREWLRFRLDIKDERIFQQTHRYGAVKPCGLSPHGAVKRIKERFVEAGFDAADYSGCGRIGEAHTRGSPFRAIMRQSGLRDAKQVLAYADVGQAA